MAVTGKFVADFSDFQTAAAAAETKLVSFESGANKVVASIERMENSLSGRKLIQDATIAAEAVENIGGVSALTESELQRLGDQATEAMEKMIRMGVDVPPSIKKIADAAAEATTNVEGMGGAADKATPRTGGLSTSLRSVDGSLRAVGVNIGPLIPLVDELGAASGKSATSLGGLGTAAAAAAAAVGGWKIGRAISEFFDLDKKIGDATAKLLGWGDVAGQEAAAGADVLAKASANAGRKITDMNEAIEINRVAVVKLQNTVKPAAFDIKAMREQMLKTEAQRVINPDATPSVVALGRATVETTNKLTDLESKLKSVERLNDSITSRLQALSNDLDQQQRERDARRQGNNSASVTSDIVGRITPLSDRDLANTSALEAMIAKLTRAIAEFNLPTFDVGAGPRASDLVRQAAQQNADNIRQLQYLQALLAGRPAGSSAGSTAPLLPATALEIPPTMGAGAGGGFGKGLHAGYNVFYVSVAASGFFDANAKRQLAAAIGDELMNTLKIGRQLGAG